MISTQAITEYPTRHPILSGLAYVVLVVICVLTTLFMLADIFEQYRARTASLEALARLEGRFSSEHGGIKHLRPTGSAFLEGKTITVANAALLQRLTSIIINARGTVVSSEMVQRAGQTKDDYVSAIANCELEQDALQRVLYEIEAGMPFLFIDQLNVRVAPDASQGARLRVMLGVAGVWTGGK